ncbi:MAG: TRAP transporter small permease [Armatimonadota bacterium]|nr:TRAP transporter small permease [Armatimonadota bacterium]
MNDLAGAGYLLGALFISFDVVARRFFGFTSRGTVEISGYLYAFGLTWALTHTLVTRGHIRVDFLVMRLPLRLRAYLHFAAATFMSGFAILLSWRAWDIVLQSWLLGARDTSALSIPLAIPQGLWAAGLTVFAVATVFILIEALALLLQSNPAAVDRLLRSPTLEEDTEAAREAAGTSPSTITAQI